MFTLIYHNYATHAIHVLELYKTREEAQAGMLRTINEYWAGAPWFICVNRNSALVTLKGTDGTRTRQGIFEILKPLHA